MKTAIAVLALCTSSVALAIDTWTGDACWNNALTCGSSICTTPGASCCGAGSNCTCIANGAYSGLNECCQTGTAGTHVLSQQCASQTDCCGNNLPNGMNAAGCRDAGYWWSDAHGNHETNLCCSNTRFITPTDNNLRAGPCITQQNCCQYVNPAITLTQDKAICDTTDPGEGGAGYCCIQIGGRATEDGTAGAGGAATPDPGSCCGAQSLDPKFGHFCSCVPTLNSQYCTGNSDSPECNCNVDSDCCSTFCVPSYTGSGKNVCQSAQSNIGMNCLDDHDCNPGTGCATAGAAGGPTVGECCGLSGFFCTSGHQCCNGACAGGTCGCYSTGSACAPNGHNDECCSGTCTAGSCT